MSLPLSTQIESVRSGSLLLASTELRGDIFQRTVIYILEHDDQGTFGLVLNRPTEAPVSSVADGWEDFAAEPALIHNGGPVRKDGFLCLGLPREGVETPADNQSFSMVAPGIAVVNLDADTHLVTAAVDRIRIFAGYSGWSSGQLAGELDRGSWYVAHGMPCDVFAGADVDLWGQVVRRHGARAGVLATHPVNVHAN